ncbi:predicted protein [Postia placenta Mad-698-R]|uniref:DUF6699 domain-containing protein n=1 Tax=Postia placenta MAD-698-R-SB12 TaxID=670580 RepID=A0A1X6MYB1_9APHY|nr:hypothetical protein POSPLADRAFT_1146700 [Postia placenta MAD-698-R-SB12]EED80725.1 predicted protein [Postia placenta Mad-698-R]OSX61232.1 hypothetical protein POSPLADRAFT_1146700 [Postia placenta MAD-698-R-SB12]
MGSSSKRVRFASDHRVPPSPGLSSSSSWSSASSNGLYTPSTSTYYHSHIIPLPQVTPYLSPVELAQLDTPKASAYTPAKSAHLVVHPCLARGHSVLSWDMIREPYGLPLPPNILAESATQPPVPRLTVTIGSGYPWRVDVEPRTSSYITVADVLHCIYRNLRSIVGSAEWDHPSTPAELKVRVSAAYHDRLRRYPDPDPRKAGIRRIDYLGDMRAFRGLEPCKSAGHVKGQPDAATLQVSLGRAS